MTTKTEDLERVVSIAKQYAEYFGDADVEPTQFVLLPGNKIVAAPLGALLNEDRARLFKAIQQGLSLTGALAHAFVSEAWSVELGDKAALERFRNSGLAVSEMPADDRIEVLFIFASANGGPSTQLSARINRDRDNNRTLGELKGWNSEGAMHGPMAIVSW
jgi:hypothetical protein